MKIQVVVGGQFGSEAKGHVARQLVDAEVNDGKHVLNVRVAGPNAGHTALDSKGNRWPLRQVPVGLTRANDLVMGYIAPGSEIDLDVLLQEIDDMDAAGLKVGSRMIVSPEATMLTDLHKHYEVGMHERIGSTGKGIGACRADRIMRTAQRLADNEVARRALADRGVHLATIRPEYVSDFGNWVIEGTQGYGLGLHAGFYPQCTSSDTRAIDFLAMAGVSPWHHDVEEFEVWVVARVYPIRVAGNSGPLANETTWADLGLPEEVTTVTHKVRRVGQWDRDLIHNAVQANGGAPIVRVALTMLDQKFPALTGYSGDYDLVLGDLPLDERVQVDDFLSIVEGDANAPVRMITTSPTTAVWRERLL